MDHGFEMSEERMYLVDFVLCPASTVSNLVQDVHERQFCFERQFPPYGSYEFF